MDSSEKMYSPSLEPAQALLIPYRPRVVPCTDVQGLAMMLFCVSALAISVASELSSKYPGRRIAIRKVFPAVDTVFAIFTHGIPAVRNTHCVQDNDRFLSHCDVRREQILEILRVP